MMKNAILYMYEKLFILFSKNSSLALFYINC